MGPTLVQKFISRTSDYGQVQYRPMILQYYEILQYHFSFLKESLCHTKSNKFTIHDWILLQQSIRLNDKR